MMFHCAWCDTANPKAADICCFCGHEAHTPRPLCKCERCTLRAAEIRKEKNALDRVMSALRERTDPCPKT